MTSFMRTSFLSQLPIKIFGHRIHRTFALHKTKREDGKTEAPVFITALVDNNVSLKLKAACNRSR